MTDRDRGLVGSAPTHCVATAPAFHYALKGRVTDGG